MAILNVSTIAEEALLVEPTDCDCDDREVCAHAEVWAALDSACEDWYCDDCVYSWHAGTARWGTEWLCRPCGREEYELALAGM